MLNQPDRRPAPPQSYDISANLKEQIDRAGLTRASYGWWAKRLAITKQSVSNHLNGSPVSEEYVDKWADSLGVDRDVLTRPAPEKFDGRQWRRILATARHCGNENEFVARITGQPVDGETGRAYSLMRQALLQGEKAGLLSLGWNENLPVTRKLEERFGLTDIGTQVVKTVRNGEGHIFDAAADVIWQHTLRLYDRHMSASGDNNRTLVVRCAIGSGYSVAAVAKRLIQLLAHNCRSAGRDGGLNLTFEFHPMASSIHTNYPADNIPSVFLHSAITASGLYELHERVFPTPDNLFNIYRVEEILEWFSENIDIVITSVASMKDPHSMLAQHLADQECQVHGALGEVQFRPYSRRGFVSPKDGSLPRTLIPIEELVPFSRTTRPNAERPLVLLVAGPCGKCHRLKVDALLPLLKVKQLRVFNYLVVDEKTAGRLLRRTPRSAS